MSEPKKRIAGIVVALGLTSLLTDLSSEMIYPLLPVFLTTVLHAAPMFIGIIEGIAEATASILKIVSGIWADRVQRRKPLVLVGYGLAGLARPLIGLATGWPFVLAMRFTDRVGKGLRTSPRDTLIADAVEPNERGRAFGFQRSMDHAGAVMGPLVAAGLLWLGLSLNHVFLLALIPASLVIVVLLVGVKEQPRTVPAGPRKPFFSHWTELSRDYKVFLGALFIFALGNSTDAFLLLRLSDAGVPAAWVAILWSVHHVVKMTSAYVGGSLSDGVGRRRIVLLGWLVYGLIYLSFALFNSLGILIATFIVYGLYFGLCEPTEKAWAVDLAPANLRGTAVGYYNGIVGIGALPASLLFGWLWTQFGAPTAFITGAAFALISAGILMMVGTGKQEEAKA